MEHSRVISSRLGSMVSSIKTEGHREVLGDERVVIMASDCPATATSLTDKRMIVALTFSTAARAESNRMEASAVHGNVKVAGAFRAE